MQTLKVDSSNLCCRAFIERVAVKGWTVPVRHAALSFHAPPVSQECIQFVVRRRNGTAVRQVLLHSSGREGSPDEQGAYLRLYSSLARLASPQQLRATAASDPEATSSEFLFFLRDMEQKAKKAEQAGRQLVAGARDSKSGLQASSPESQPPQSLVGQSMAAPAAQYTVAVSGSEGSGTAAVWQPSGAVTAHGQSSAGVDTRAGQSPDRTTGITAQAVARVAAELVALREEQELHASSRLLPSLASSLAYDNLLRWRREQQGADGRPPSGTTEGVLSLGGVPVEELYRAGEVEEQKLQEEQQKRQRLRAQQHQPPWAPGGGLSQGGGGSNSMTSFAEKPGNEAFKEMAAMAMARMRSRLVGYDDEAEAAAAVLNALLAAGLEWGRGGWADLMHEAFHPPGITRAPGDAGPAASHQGEGQGKVGRRQAGRVCTTPEALKDAIHARMTDQEPGSDSSALQLVELLEDLEEYATHVWSRRKPLERYG